jgi:hypothetical protein
MAEILTQEKTTMVCKRVLVTLTVFLSFVPLLEASRSVVVSPSPLQRASSEQSLRAARLLLADLDYERASLAGTWFGTEQTTFIRNWFSWQAQLGALPVEMVQHDAPLPLRKDGILPADLRQQVQPLPPDLERLLPELSGNLRRVFVLGDVVIFEDDTLRIVDLIPGVL